MPTMVWYKGQPIWVNTEVPGGVSMKVFTPITRPKEDPPKIGKLQEIANILAAEFEIAPPKVVVGGRRKTGAHYSPWYKEIYIPFAGTWRGTEHSLIHEFAHHLTDTKYNFPVKKVRPHGLEFIESLRLVVLAWFGDLHAYNWETEYKSIRAWYDRRKK